MPKKENIMPIVDILDLAKYVGLNFIALDLEISHLKLHKMLYYIQAWHMVNFGKNNTLFTENPQAWANGPVYTSVWDKYKKNHNNRQELTYKNFGLKSDDVNSYLSKMAITKILNKKQKDLINQAIMIYGTKSQDQLVFLTHCEKPWVNTRNGLLPWEPCQNEISFKSMYDFFKQMKK